MELHFKNKSKKQKYNRYTPSDASELPMTAAASSGDYRRHVSETSHSHEGGGISYEASGGAKSKVKNNSKKHVTAGGAGGGSDSKWHSSPIRVSLESHSVTDYRIMGNSSRPLADRSMSHLCVVNGNIKPNKYRECVSPYYCLSVRENRICINCGEDAKAAQVRDGIMDENAGRGWLHGICGFGWICRKNNKDGRKPCTLNHPKVYNYCEVSIESETVTSSAPIRSEEHHSVSRAPSYGPEIAATFSNAVSNVISARAAAAISVPVLATHKSTVVASMPASIVQSTAASVSVTRSEEIDFDSMAHMMVSNLVDDAPPGLSRNSMNSSAPEPSEVARVLATPTSESIKILKAREAKLLFHTTMLEAIRINDMSDNSSFDAMLIGIKTAMFHIHQRVNGI